VIEFEPILAAVRSIVKVALSMQAA